MATRAEQFRSEQEKRGRPSRTSKRQPKKAAWKRTSTHAASKATHAFEQSPRGSRPSRESTRGSANRAKADSARNVTEQTTKGSPRNVAQRSRAKRAKVRGHGA